MQRGPDSWWLEETIHAGREHFDPVYSRYALHHLPDFWKAIALTRAADLLRSGGVPRLWDVPAIRLPEAMNGAAAQSSGSAPDCPSLTGGAY
jgi:hypothetical protein